MFNRLNTNTSAGFSGFARQNAGLLTYVILAVALLGFEMFNFSTTQFALEDLLGDLRFIGIQWATILAIAFCGIDFAGIGRLFLPDRPDHAAQESWYLFGAWLLAATMNALLTWWGVSMALVGHQMHSTEIMDRKLLMLAVPVFVAVMVWVTRVLLIGSFAMAGRRSQGQAARYPAHRPPSQYLQNQATSPQPIRTTPSSYPRPAQSGATNRPAPLPMSSYSPVSPSKTALPTPLEPEYIPEGDAAAPASSAIPALRPLALSARPVPGSGNQERKF